MTRLGTILTATITPNFTAPKKPYTGQRVSLTPAGEAALQAFDKAREAEAALTEDSDAYDVAMAFDAALDADPQNHALLTRFTARFPQFADELMSVGYARFAFGMTLTDPVEESL